MINRFGKKIPIIPVDEQHFKTAVRVAVSSQFIGWGLSLENGIMISGPEKLKEKMRSEVLSVYKLYEGIE